MAFEIAIDDSAIGVAFPQAYARVATFHGDKNQMQVLVAFHANEAARRAGAQEVRLETFPVPTPELPDDGPLLQGIYIWLKANVPLFGGARDV